jgi:hypothetical protein
MSSATIRCDRVIALIDECLATCDPSHEPASWPPRRIEPQATDRPYAPDAAGAGPIVPMTLPAEPASPGPVR